MNNPPNGISDRLSFSSYAEEFLLMLLPDDCTNMADIRHEIDQIDRDVIELLGRRFVYVQAAAKFKASQAEVSAPERFAALLQQRRVWAEDVGLSADVIEKLYRDLVTYFIQEESKRWEENQM